VLLSKSAYHLFDYAEKTNFEEQGIESLNFEIEIICLFNNNLVIKNLIKSFLSLANAGLF
jgi:hypothetical protein